MSAPTIVITGAAGNIGGKLRRHLEQREICHLRLIDIAPHSDHAILQANLAVREARWMDLFAEASVVVHAAGQPSSEAGWPSLISPNIDAVLNVYMASQAAGVPRVVALSSVWTMAGQRNGACLLRARDADPGDNAYGATKLMGERIGRAYWEAHGIGGAAIRLGGCLPGANTTNRSGPGWERDCWISNSDMLEGMERAIFGEYTGFHILNLTSANPGSRWTLEEARDVLGYDPAPQEPPTAAPAGRSGLRQRMWRWFHRFI